MLFSEGSERLSRKMTPEEKHAIENVIRIYEQTIALIEARLAELKSEGVANLYLESERNVRLEVLDRLKKRLAELEK